MDLPKATIPLEEALDLSELVTSGSLLQINDEFNIAEEEFRPELEQNAVDFIGQTVQSFNELEKQMKPVDTEGYVKKKIIEQGGGLNITEEFTVSIAYSGYWEKDLHPFDVVKSDKPMDVNLIDNSLLPGLQIAIRSMLVGETSVFLLSYKVMYGEMGIPPRIKPKSDCVFYIHLIRSLVTPKIGPINLKESNMFQRVKHEVQMLYCSGQQQHEAHRYLDAIKLFKKAVNMLHKCRLANEEEEKQQEKLLTMIYISLSIVYNQNKQPLKACIACNELNYLKQLWNNYKALYQNAKALRMIGDFSSAEKKLHRALKLQPEEKKIQEELELVQSLRKKCDQNKLVNKNALPDLVSEEFKNEVRNIIKNFKEDSNMIKFSLPCELNKYEKEFIRKTCIAENLFFNKILDKYALDKEELEETSLVDRDILDI